MGATFVPEQPPFLVYKLGSGSTSATQTSCFHSFWLPERWCIHLTPPALWARKQEGAPHLTISVQMWGGDLVKDSRLVLTASLQPRETASLYAPEIRTEPKASWRKHNQYPGLPWGLSNKESTCNAGELGLIPGLGRSPGAGHGNPLQYSCLENLMDRGAWWATVHRVAKSWTRLK